SSTTIRAAGWRRWSSPHADPHHRRRRQHGLAPRPPSAREPASPPAAGAPHAAALRRERASQHLRVPGGPRGSCDPVRAVPGRRLHRALRGGPLRAPTGEVPAADQRRLRGKPARGSPRGRRAQVRAGELSARTRLLAEKRVFAACDGTRMVPVVLRVGAVYGRGLRGVRGALRDRGAAHARLRRDRHGIDVGRHLAHEAGAAAPARVPVAARGPGPALRSRWLAGLVVLAVLAPAVWGFVIEPNRLVVRETRLALPRWPAALDGLRLAVVADIHAGAPWVDDEKVERLVAEVNDTRPELVLLLGDFV